MDIFALRDRVVTEYRDYFESFINILDDRLRGFVKERLADGEMWPDAVLQLNPAYEPGPTLEELSTQGVITPETARFFGKELRLYRHQEEALKIALRGEPYIVSTGTGSGKSLTYLIPIFEYIIRNDPSRHSVRAIIVYPMNALINSQLESLERFKKNWPHCPVRFARYTGQENQEAKNAILNDPPHILLTNYVMLEYLLIRPYERTLVQQATRELRFLVMDELHVYRGRQGADVAMLMRRVRQRAGRADLQVVGTSATLVTEGDREARRRRIAEVGAQLFGMPVPNVVDETLKRVAVVQTPKNQEELRAAIQAKLPEPTLAAVTCHPLAAWVEETFGLQMEDGRLVRRPPIAFSEGLKILVEETGLDENLCLERLKAVLDAGNAAQLPSGEPVFAFRLHQFMASGSSVYTTLETPAERYLTTAGHYVVPGDEGQEEKVLFPLAFCRECGQEHYLTSLVSEGATTRLIPRSPLLTVSDDDISGTPGFFSLEEEELWDGNLEDLPENWLEARRGGVRAKSNYAAHVPQPFWVAPNGILNIEPQAGAPAGWFQPRPLMLCLRCRAAYDLREKSDFRKLSTLSQVGRSTATTITTTAAVVAMRQDEGIDPAARKVLSFTDNRQDASLQAGHLNDFAQVILLRGALVRALQQEGTLTLDCLGPAIFKALKPSPQDFMKSPVPSGPGYEEAKRAMVDLLDNLILEDLARAWRIAQPNLEQCGLVRINYAGLDELALDEERWAHAPVISEVDGKKRLGILRAVLDHLRGVLAIDAGILEEDHTRSLVIRVFNSLRAPWTFEKNERLREATVAVLPQVPPNNRNDRGGIRLGFRSAIGRYLRSRHTWGREEDLSGLEVEALILQIVSVLQGHIFSIVRRNGADYGIQIRAGALQWEQGDGKAPGPDPVRAKSLYLRREEHIKREPNRYFENLYAKEAQWLTGIIGSEHTGQIQIDRRIEREKDFREGKLPALFCSPTMELGVDIADLTVVHLRNVPPTPANYAQRSGRAGRGGKPALVVTFSSYGNAHDQYFFRQKTRMIAGAVAPPRMDLGSKDLVEAHLHSVWLAMTGSNMKSSMVDLLDLNSPNYPLLPEKKSELNLSNQRQQEVIAVFQAIVALVGPPITAASWFSPQWLLDTVRVAPEAFNRSMDRWRELHKAAIEQRDAARRKIDDPRLPRSEREKAERQQNEALREIDLLLNRGERATETDFYPYRYLATEGFLPGYNFPRLPLRALVWTGERTEIIDRPRFLGLSEFGPQNVIYHEGRKHRVMGCRVPGGDIDRRLCRAKLCLVCGYIHPREEAEVDLCFHCGTRMDGNTCDFPQRLFDQPTVKASRWVRINSEEEERAREGYHLTTHYWFSPGTSPNVVSVQVDGDSDPIMEMTYVPQAQLWRINHGWRRSEERNGFGLDGSNGRWIGSNPDQEDDGGVAGGNAVPIQGVKPYVTDNRNILLLHPATERGELPFLKTLSYALQRSIQVIYQVEEQEVAIELIGRDEHQRILLWEAAEGGTGVWERILGDAKSMAEIAREALKICHYDPGTGEENASQERPCGPACYDCLLSYSNQKDHRYLDRVLVRNFLLQLGKAKILQPAGSRNYEEQYQWLRDNLDPASSLEQEFLDFLYNQKLKLPDFAQYRPDNEVPVQPDFYYQRDRAPGICVFIDGPAHDNPRRAEQDKSTREALQERGYRVVVIRYDRTFYEQVSETSEIFRTT